MRARWDHHAGAGHRGRTSARWRGAVVVAAAALSLAVGAVPASAAGGYTVTATIPVGSGPDGVAVDPAAGTVYVTNYGDGTVSVIDAATNTVTATIPVGSGPDGVAVDPAAGTVYVTNEQRWHGVGDRRGDQRRDRHHPRRLLARTGWRWTPPPGPST